MEFELLYWAQTLQSTALPADRLGEVKPWSHQAAVWTTLDGFPNSHRQQKGFAEAFFFVSCAITWKKDVWFHYYFEWSAFVWSKKTHQTYIYKLSWQRKLKVTECLFYPLSHSAQKPFGFSFAEWNREACLFQGRNTCSTVPFSNLFFIYYKDASCQGF